MSFGLKRTVYECTDSHVINEYITIELIVVS
jgi:hypothetical protein